MRYRARLPYTDRSTKLGYAYGQPINHYWVMIYKWDDESKKYITEVVGSFVNRERAEDCFRSISVTNDIPCVEVWAKFRKARPKLFTYKGIKRRGNYES